MFSNAGIAPAAEGYAKVKEDKNKNYDIKIDVIHLAPSEDLNPPKKNTWYGSLLKMREIKISGS